MRVLVANSKIKLVLSERLQYSERENRIRHQYPQGCRAEGYNTRARASPALAVSGQINDLSSLARRGDPAMMDVIDAGHRLF